MSEVLSVDDLGKSFGDATALAGVGLALDPGERLAVLGRSGGGKTTLLRLIAGLESPSTGEVRISGKVASRAGRVLIPPERRGVALVFQGLALFPNLRALDQVAFAARGRGGVEFARSLLDRVGLGRRADARLDELSGGERQRIALARALAQKPEFLLMDEPFASLDDERRAEMRGLLRSLLEEVAETTLILVTHSRADAFDLARRVVVLDEGRPVADGLLETLVAHPRHAAAVRALGLGQLIPGLITARGDAETAFGPVLTSPGTRPGPATLLVRPDQPRLAADGEGVEAEVASSGLQPSEGGDARRIAFVRAGGGMLHVRSCGRCLTVGERVRVRIEGQCESVLGA